MSNERTASQLKRMNKPQLATLAQSEGHSLDGEESKEDLIEMIVGAPTSQTRAPGEGVKQDQKRSPLAREEHGYVMIHSGEGEGGAQPVDVTINGHNYRIPRDKSVKVPLPVIEVLRNAVETRLEEIGRDPVTGAPTFRERHVRRFPVDYNTSVA